MIDNPYDYLTDIIQVQYPFVRPKVHEKKCVRCDDTENLTKYKGWWFCPVHYAEVIGDEIEGGK